MGSQKARELEICNGTLGGFACNAVAETYFETYKKYRGHRPESDTEDDESIHETGSSSGNYRRP